MKIFLLGFMGVGKTFQSKLIAKDFNLALYDLDEVIEKTQGCSISAIFSKNGEYFFRQKEKECLRDFAVKDNFVLSCGGGTPCYFDNMTFINQQGISIWINESSEIIFNRLKNEKKQRPLIANYSDEELKEFIKNKNEERKYFYQQAKIKTNFNLNTTELINKYVKKNKKEVGSGRK